MLRSLVLPLADGGLLRGSAANPPSALTGKRPHYASTGYCSQSGGSAMTAASPGHLGCSVHTRFPGYSTFLPTDWRKCRITARKRTAHIFNPAALLWGNNLCVDFQLLRNLKQKQGDDSRSPNMLRKSPLSGPGLINPQGAHIFCRAPELVAIRLSLGARRPQALQDFELRRRSWK